MAVGVQSDDGDIEGCLGCYLGRGADLEMSRRPGLHLECPDVNGAAYDTWEAGASLIKLRRTRVVAGVDGRAAGEQGNRQSRAAGVLQRAKHRIDGLFTGAAEIAVRW